MTISAHELLRLQSQARGNLARFSGNPYPGRVIICGVDESGWNLVQLYAIMGRSENSRNRVLSVEGSRLFTEAADPSKVRDPSLIIYNAMREAWCIGHTTHFVSNGAQTDDVARTWGGMRGFYRTIRRWSYEPDKPNFTPRITASSRWRSFGLFKYPIVQMSILRKSLWGKDCDHHLYQFNDIGRGFGYCFHTYSGDGDPLPAFRGEPYLLPLLGDPGDVMNAYWDAFNADNIVSLAVKFIPRGGDSTIVVKNRYPKVA